MLLVWQHGLKSLLAKAEKWLKEKLFKEKWLKEKLYKKQEMILLFVYLHADLAGLLDVPLMLAITTFPITVIVHKCLHGQFEVGKISPKKEACDHSNHKDDDRGILQGGTWTIAKNPHADADHDQE
ncbi:hypothetical protein BFG52_14600 [Acinetobacter larvae]|uniref:Uncharacterized protein n=1 Tax=Acinetobacter larvae TaxID=1789224 RepID=A0A1B2M2M9_9GAMM|nr:hypothetical protein BFG52_14600 [Acinetobacter larvae]